jgi:phosphoribosyl 1,2-cyclic phosphodiesterase
VPLGSLTITFLGVRGSTPCHGPQIARYGGNTSCVLVEADDEPPLLFDLGTGVRDLGAGWPAEVPFEGACLLTHLHWDHIQGLPFFSPILRPGARLDVFAPVQDSGSRVADVFAATICPPLFPVHLADFAGHVRFHDVGNEEFMVGSYQVTARSIPHIGPTLGYRIERDGRSIAYLSDHQQPFDGSHSVMPGAMELVSDVDVLIHDSQYTPAEFAKKCDWGHCTVDYAVWLAQEARVKTLVLFHHDPLRDDDALDALSESVSSELAGSGCSLVVAREGLRIQLP